jgi:hypothetical protein
MLSRNLEMLADSFLAETMMSVALTEDTDGTEGECVEEVDTEVVLSS